mmetsp:Transcript_129/g.343  ORF Transcript_129/g.343 Transcript_129/m.343 type:complete len:491 (-) Transcript_129:8-1480(-)
MRSPTSSFGLLIVSATGLQYAHFNPNRTRTRTAATQLSYANNDGEGSVNKLFVEPPRPPSRRIPMRAVQHVQMDPAAEAKRAGFVVRDTVSDTTEGRRQRRRARTEERKDQIRRKIYCGIHEHDGMDELENIPKYTEKVERPRRNGALSVRRREPEFQVRNQVDGGGKRIGSRVRFKASREASRLISSRRLVATIDEYMRQEVKDYSLLSFHDEEQSGISKQRRWFVRRLTEEEAHGYLSGSPALSHVANNVENLFRLAVPLEPLIGWDLTPVIDLEVTPPDIIARQDVGRGEMSGDEADDVTARWRFRRSKHTESPPVVRIRSLSVSLLSTQEEVKKAMMVGNHSQPTRRDRKIQREAIGMVGKVEELLQPHISFEAELSWIEDVAPGSTSNVQNNISTSEVMCKSSACTSLTIPKIPSDILRAAVPSSFLVKRLGSTLTSKALAICLPRFLRQLEKDYARWSGTELDETAVQSAKGGILLGKLNKFNE